MSETTVSQSEKFMTVETNDFAGLRPRLVTLAKEGWSLIGWWQRRSLWDKLFGRKGYLTLDFVKAVAPDNGSVSSSVPFEDGYRRLFRENNKLVDENKRLDKKLGRAQERIRTLENRTENLGNYIPKTTPIYFLAPKRKARPKPTGD